MPYYAEYLAHHGVKGQKWGVRRYQNEDGTLTNAGKQRYTDQNDSEKSNKQAIPSEEKKKARREHLRKILGIAAGVTVTAIVAHKVSQGLKNAGKQFDASLERGIDPLRPFAKNLSKEGGMAYMIPKGSPIQRLSLYDESKSKGHAYVTFQQEDNERYKGFFEKNLERRAALNSALGRKATTVYIHDITAKEDLFSPDKSQRLKTFIEMYNDNPVGVGRTLGNYHTKEYHNQGKLPAFVYRKQYSNLKGSRKITKGYQTFVKALGDNSNAQLRNEYFRRLKTKGFNMVQDDQDSGRQGIRPTIVFDRAKSLSYNGKRELLSDEIKEAYRKYGRRVAKKDRHREWLV